MNYLQEGDELKWEENEIDIQTQSPVTLKTGLHSHV